MNNENVEVSPLMIEAVELRYAEMFNTPEVNGSVVHLSVKE